MPFDICIEDSKENILINNKEPVLKFYYNDIQGDAELNQKELLDYLSAGEKRAFYILNIIYELELRKLEQKDTLIVADDLADSFDYGNKYAIIEYLNDILCEDFFKIIILTHNFDFCRTLSSRLNIGRENIFIAEKNKKLI